MPPILRHPSFDVIVVAFRRFNIEMRTEDRFRKSGCELASLVGSTGLHQHWVTLGRTRNVERSAHLTILSDVIEIVHLFRVEEQTAFLVPYEGVVVPGIPKAFHDRRELVRALVALVVRHRGRAAEVEG